MCRSKLNTQEQSNACSCLSEPYYQLAATSYTISLHTTLLRTHTRARQRYVTLTQLSDIMYNTKSTVLYVHSGSAIVFLTVPTSPTERLIPLRTDVFVLPFGTALHCAALRHHTCSFTKALFYESQHTQTYVRISPRVE
jgi:hypothetical protein